MKLGYAIVYVPNVPETMDFYAKAFGLDTRFLHESQQYGEMETGNTTLAFADETFVSTRECFRPNRPSDKAAGFEIAFVATDVPAPSKELVIPERYRYQAPRPNHGDK